MLVFSSIIGRQPQVGEKEGVLMETDRNNNHYNTSIYYVLDPIKRQRKMTHKIDIPQTILTLSLLR